MASFTVDVETVLDEIKRARNAVAQQQDNLGEIQNQMSFMEDAWEDDAQKTYSNNFQSTKANVKKFNHALEAYLNELSVFVRGLVTKDRTVATSLERIAW